VAIMDLNGQVLSVKSFKEATRSDIVSHIIGYGKAVLISTDVYPPPKMVKKLSSILQARIDAPSRFMTVESKIEAVDVYLNEKSSFSRSKVVHSDEIPQNAHERDALAAALKTYKKYQNKLQQIARKADELDLNSSDVDNVNIMFLLCSPVTKAMDYILESREDRKSQIDRDPNPESQLKPDGSFRPSKDEDGSLEYLRHINRLKQKIRSQETEIKNLKKQNLKMEDKFGKAQLEISNLKEKIEDLHYQYSKGILEKKELASKITIIKRLQDKYQHEKDLRQKLEENLRSIKNIQALELSKSVVPVKIIESFTREGIKEACDYWKIKEKDVVFLKNSKGGGSHTASLIIQRGIKAVIVNDQMSHTAEEEFEKNMIPLLPRETVDLKMIDKFAVVSADSLRSQIENWETQVRDRKASEDRKKLLSVIDEYRAKRRRSADNS
jgi:predicted RNase H-like nuclease (RuvC/YqgF family)